MFHAVTIILQTAKCCKSCLWLLKVTESCSQRQDTQEIHDLYNIVSLVGSEINLLLKKLNVPLFL
jgi:hypothetical protein